MYELLIRFRLIKNNDIYEVIFDSRLSFEENFVLLKKIIGIDLLKYKVYDFNKKIFLKRNISLNEFNFDRFVQLYLFWF